MQQFLNFLPKFFTILFALFIALKCLFDICKCRLGLAKLIFLIVCFRFFQKLKALPHEKLQKYTTIDYFNEMAIVGIIGEPGSEKMVAIGRYIVDHSDNFAEVAFVLADDYQSHGIGTFVLNYLVEIALQRGINGFKADVLAANKKMLGTFAKLPYKMETQVEDDVYTLRIPFKKRERQTIRFKAIDPDADKTK